jgi:DNA-binding PadR family transcriptional regulator
MTERALTDFEHILVGFIARSPSTTYDLKKLFAGSPASVYQPSAGALVPALRRLEQRGYLQVHDDLGPRTRRIYSITAKGRAAHLAWLRQPVELEHVGRDLGVHLMRFVMAEPELSKAEVLGFLAELAGALERFHGIAVHRASLAWARAAMAALGVSAEAGGSVPGQERASAPPPP